MNFQLKDESKTDLFQFLCRLPSKSTVASPGRTRWIGSSRWRIEGGKLFSGAFDAKSIAAVAVATVEPIVQLAILHGAVAARLHRHHHLFTVSRVGGSGTKGQQGRENDY